MRVSKQSFCVITGNVCTRCSVYCVVSTKKAQRLQTDLHLHDRNATMTSGFGGRSFMNLLMQSAHFLWSCFGVFLSFHILAFAYKFPGLKMRRWCAIDFPAKQFAIRFGCVYLVVS